MKEVGVAEAESHFSSLIDSMAMGEESVIVRDGHPIARLLPVLEEEDSPAAIQAAARIRARAAALPIHPGWEELKGDREAGRL